MAGDRKPMTNPEIAEAWRRCIYYGEQDGITRIIAGIALGEIEIEVTEEGMRVWATTSDALGDDDQPTEPQPDLPGDA